MRFWIVIAVMGFFLASALAPRAALGQSRPAVSGYDLAGERVVMPAARGGKPVLAIVSFEAWAGEAEAKTWRTLAQALDLAHTTILAEDDGGRLSRVARAGRLRAQAPQGLPPSAVAIMFAPPPAVQAAFGFERVGGTQVALIGSDGAVLALASGAAGPEAAATFARALAAGPIAGAGGQGRIDPSGPALLAQAPLSPEPVGRASAALSVPRVAAVSIAPAAPPGPPSSTPPSPAPPSATPFEAISLTGVRTMLSTTDQTVALARSGDDLPEALSLLERLEREGRCAQGCQVLVAVGARPFPSRAIALGRLRADVPEQRQAAVAAALTSPASLFVHFGASDGGSAPVEARVCSQGRCRPLE